MSITRTQVVTPVSGGAGTTITGTSVSATWGSTTGSGVGKLLVACLSHNQFPTIPVFTPPAGWVTDAQLRVDSATLMGQTIFYILNPGSTRSGAESFGLGTDNDAVLTLIEYSSSSGRPFRLLRGAEKVDINGASSQTCPQVNAPGIGDSVSLVAVGTRENATLADSDQSAPTLGYTQIAAAKSRAANVEGMTGAVYELINPTLKAVYGPMGVTFAGGVYSAIINAVFTDNVRVANTKPDYSKFPKRILRR